MADWPDAEEIKQVLDVVSDDWETTLDRVRSAAIAKVQQDIGYQTDEPDDSLAQAALRMAELISERPGTPVVSLGRDPAYKALLTGHRRAWGIA